MLSGTMSLLGITFKKKPCNADYIKVVSHTSLYFKTLLCTPLFHYGHRASLCIWVLLRKLFLQELVMC